MTASCISGDGGIIAAQATARSYCLSNLGRLALAVIAVAAVAGIAVAAPRAPARSAFPVMLRDALGNRVTVRAEPQRIVSLAPAMTEILFALGLGPRVVGVTDYCDYPSAARAKAKVGGIVNPSVERILAQRPDLVIGMRLNPKPVLRTLTNAGIPTYAGEPRNLEQVLTTTEAVGKLTGRGTEAAALIERLQARVRAVRERVRGRGRPTVILVYSQDPLWVAGADTFPDNLIELAGGRNAANDVTGYKQYNVETLLAHDPQVILLTSMAGGSGAAQVHHFASRPAMRNLAAVRAGRVYVVNADMVDRAGPRIVQGLEEIAAALHPARASAPSILY